MRRIFFLLIVITWGAGELKSQVLAKQVYNEKNEPVNVFFGPGYGAGYGGLGAKLLIVISGNNPTGFHGGLGCYFYEKNSLLSYSIGLKSYVAHLVYVNFQYSIFGQETTQILKTTSTTSYFYGSQNTTFNTSEVPYTTILRGPGLHVGTDMLITERVGINIGVGINKAMRRRYTSREFYYVSEIGLFFKLDNE